MKKREKRKKGEKGEREKWRKGERENPDRAALSINNYQYPLITILISWIYQ